MINPDNITNFNRTKGEKEEFLLFCICVAMIVREIETGDYYIILDARPGQYDMGTIWYVKKYQIKEGGEVIVIEDITKMFDSHDDVRSGKVEFVCKIKPKYYDSASLMAEINPDDRNRERVEGMERLRHRLMHMSENPPSQSLPLPKKGLH